ncbi:variable surface protein [Plasmodium gonderi]|uniref:Variable surface protein n=1 Tax=Plasmodium gonderi TaxID=77519 RepID=A0A1Y1JBE6_PLAGO|nr:variable surface protein [Plasmodium gonderi]GAW79861.1 variable surface protein [Plasmodium gonderi]
MLEGSSTNNWDDITKVLLSGKIYNEFNKDEDSSEYNDVCKLTAKYHTENTELETICKKFIRSLKDILSNKYKEKSMDYCMLLKYWLNDELKKKYITSKPNRFGEVILTQKLNNLQYSVLGETKDTFECYDNYYYSNNFGDEKVLTEYFVNFDEINSNIKSKKDENKYMVYLKYIDELYTKKISNENCCSTKYPHLCDHYFRCDSMYDPRNLLFKLNVDKERRDIKSQAKSVRASQTPKSVKGSAPQTELNEANVQIPLPNVPYGWHKRRNKYRTRIINTKCLVNYASRNEGYALVSCYSPERGHRNLENIMGRTIEEDDFYDKLSGKNGRNKQAGHAGSWTPTVRISHDGSVQSGDEITEESKTSVGIPAELKGSQALGEMVRRIAGETFGKYSSSNKVAHEFSNSGRNDNFNKGFEMMHCAHILKKDDGSLICEEPKEFIYESAENQEGKNSLFSSKFTPFGTWINKKMNRTKKTKQKMNMGFEQSPQRGNKPQVESSPPRGNRPLTSSSPPKGNRPNTSRSPSKGNKPLTSRSPPRGNRPMTSRSPSRPTNRNPPNKKARISYHAS